MKNYVLLFLVVCSTPTFGTVIVSSDLPPLAEVSLSYNVERIGDSFKIVAEVENIFSLGGPEFEFVNFSLRGGIGFFGFESFRYEFIELSESLPILLSPGVSTFVELGVLSPVVPASIGASILLEVITLFSGPDVSGALDLRNIEILVVPSPPSLALILAPLILLLSKRPRYRVSGNNTSSSKKFRVQGLANEFEKGLT